MQKDLVPIRLAAFVAVFLPFFFALPNPPEEHGTPLHYHYRSPQIPDHCDSISSYHQVSHRRSMAPFPRRVRPSGR
jgi:hypothetical protein